jgi:hypothetical protein
MEVMSTSVYTGLNPFNFIRKHSIIKHFICIALQLLFLTPEYNEMSHNNSTLQRQIRYRQPHLSAQRLSERTVFVMNVRTLVVVCVKLVVICVKLVVYLCCSMYCLCVNVYCTTATGVTTQFQLTLKNRASYI